MGREYSTRRGEWTESWRILCQKGEGKRHCMEGEGTGRGVSSKVEWLPGWGEPLRKIMEIHLSPFTTFSFLSSLSSSYILSLFPTNIFWRSVLPVISGAWHFRKDKTHPYLLAACTWVGELDLKSLLGPARTETINERKEDNICLQIIWYACN